MLARLDMDIQAIPMLTDSMVVVVVNPVLWVWLPEAVAEAEAEHQDTPAVQVLALMGVPAELKMVIITVKTVAPVAVVETTTAGVVLDTRGGLPEHTLATTTSVAITVADASGVPVGSLHTKRPLLGLRAWSSSTVTGKKRKKRMPNYAVVVNNVIENVLISSVAVTAPEGHQLIEETVTTGNVMVGGTYDPVLGIFRPPSPFASWVFDVGTRAWQAPEPRPDDATQRYFWNESEKKWKGDGIAVSTGTVHLSQPVTQGMQTI